MSQIYINFLFSFIKPNALKVIRFGGTREKWKELTQDVNILWRSKTDRLTVVCSDGEMPFRAADNDGFEPLAIGKRKAAYALYLLGKIDRCDRPADLRA